MNFHILCYYRNFTLSDCQETLSVASLSWYDDQANCPWHDFISPELSLTRLDALPRMSEIQKDAVSLPTKCLAYMGMFEERTETAHHATIMKTPGAHNERCKFIWNKYIIFLVLSLLGHLEMKFGIELTLVDHLFCIMHCASYLNLSFNPKSHSKYFY